MKNNSLAYILITVGVLVLLGNLNVLNGEISLLAVGMAFLVFYGLSGQNYETRKVGLLIPALIIMAVASFALLESTFDIGAYFFFSFIGLAFLGVYLIHTRHMDHGKWPIYPALSLFGFSIFILVATRFNFKILGIVMNNLIPVAAIVAGLVLLFKPRKKVE